MPIIETPTPGPWTVHHFVAEDVSQEPTQSGVYEIEEANKAINELIADKRALSAKGMAEANRRLIQAAPDLLEACEMALRLCGSNGYGRGPVQEALFTAIDKARGR